MVRFLLRSGLLLLITAMPLTAPAAALTYHDLHVVLAPDQGRIEVRDRITPASDTNPRALTFTLHAGLQPTLVEPGATLIDEGSVAGPVPVHRYRLTLPAGKHSVSLRYAGRIAHPLTGVGEAGARGRRYTPGLIGPQGVYLDGNSHWYPMFGDGPLGFTLKVQLPAGWSAVSQGEPLPTSAGDSSAWQERQPQDDIYLVAGRFHQYRRQTPWGEALVFLRAADPGLAQRYLDATAHYLDLYSRLLGPYPYKKFALVENFWETGYGMPSFTLLGPRVLRLPFILHSSYPHEILHNWWGNSVYVDYATGNWSEGLTSYLADHLIAQQNGHGVEYRRASLQKYADYVAKARDFPLVDFRARHGEVSQAIGYSKSLMFFHMLRRRLGDDTFVRGLRRFYRDNRFRRAGFRDIRTALEAASGKDLGPMFRQWLDRTGAPELRIGKLSVTRDGDHYRLQGMLRQVQKGPAYTLRVPVAVQLKDTAQAFQTTVAMGRKHLALDLELPTEPLSLAVDPQFDLFRRLAPAELPPSLGQVFGADRVLFVLPSAAAPELRAAYRRLAERWAGGQARLAWVLDSKLKQLPRDRAVWLFGWKNRFRGRLAAALAGQDVRLTAAGAEIGGRTLKRATDSVVLEARNAGVGLAWLGADNPAALPGLARKLPHYGKYGFLAFTGDAPDNVLKGQWRVLHSPLKVDLAPADQDRPSLKLAPRPPLTAVIDTIGPAE